MFNGTQKDLLQYQKDKYHSLLQYANIHVPYYREQFARIGLFKDGILDESRLCDIPVLLRENVRTFTEKLKSDEFDSLGVKSNSSSGSTGEPVTVYHCERQQYCGKEDKLLFGMLNGKKPGDFWIKLWGNENHLSSGIMRQVSPPGHRYNDCLLLYAFRLSDERLRIFTGEIQKRKPVMIWAYADQMFQLSRFVVSNGIQMYCPVSILTTGSMLSPQMKSVIQKAFPSSKVSNQYGATEVGTIGCEVDGEEGLRAFEHSVKLEVVHEDGSITDDGSGELLVTTLNNHAMPLIRYKLGDIVSITHDLGGRKGSFALITSLKGKSTVHIKKANGDVIFGQFFLDLFCTQEWVERFKVIQKSYTELEIHLVLRQGYTADEDALSSILEAIDREMGKCKYDIIYEKEIKPMPSGKYEYIRSCIKDEQNF